MYPYPSVRRLATVLDFVLIAVASATVVVLLGGGRTFSLGGVALVVKSAVPLGVMAAALLALRWLHWRHLPALPSIPREPLRFEDEYQRIVAAPPVTTRVALYAVAAILGSMVWVVPHLLHLRDVPDPGDPIFSAWRIAALAHQLATDPRHLWNGNIFYPLPLTLTYSDSTFLQALIGAPFLLAGVDPLVVMNALMVASFPIRGAAYFFVGWRLTGDPQAGLVAALAGAWAPFHADHYSQLELQWTAFVPLALFFLMRLLAAPGWKSGIAFGAAVAAQCLSCMYVAVMLVSALVPFTAVLLVAWRVRPSRQLAAAVAATAMVLLPIVGLLGSAYMKSRDAHGDRGLREVADGSAAPRAYRDATERLVTHHWQSRFDHQPERELFPGFTAVALAAVAIAPPLGPGVIATLAAGAAAFDWSLGLKGLTYDELYRLSPVYRGMRVPARFSALVQAALALLTAYGAHRLLRGLRSPVTRGAVCAVLCGAVLVDLRMDPFLQQYPRGVPPIYRHVKSRMVLAEMPADHTLDYMYFSTRHWARLLNGYSGFGPDLAAHTAAEQAFPAPEAVASFHALGATDLTYNCAFEKANRKEEADCQRVFDALDKNPTLGLVAREMWRGSEVRLYRYR